MPQNRLKYFPTAMLRRGMAHFHPSLPMPGYVPPARGDEGRGNVWTETGGPRPTAPLSVDRPDPRIFDGTPERHVNGHVPRPAGTDTPPAAVPERLPSPARD